MAKARRWGVGILLAFALGLASFAIDVSVWTRRQLLAGPLQGVCLRPQELALFRSNKRDNRGILARAALFRGYPGRVWGPSIEWQLHFASVSYLGFLFLPDAERSKLVENAPHCRG